MYVCYLLSFSVNEPKVSGKKRGCSDPIRNYENTTRHCLASFPCVSVSMFCTFITGPPGPPGPPGQPSLPGDFVCPARPNHGVEGRPIMLRANHFQVSSVLASASHSYILQEECDSLDGKRLAGFIHFSSDSSQLRQTKIVWVFTMCLKSWMAPSAKKLRGKAVLVEQVNVTSSVAIFGSIW